MVENTFLSNPRACAAAKLGSIILGSASVLLTMAYVPYGSSLIVAVGIGAAAYAKFDELPSGRAPFAGCVLIAALYLAASGVLYGKLIGSLATVSGGVTATVNTGIANMLALAYSSGASLIPIGHARHGENHIQGHLRKKCQEMAGGRRWQRPR